jgi:hypothetical protein
MAKVTLGNALFKVVLTEYDRFSGRKHWDTWYFDNEAEARKAAIDYNLEHNNKDYVPEWYVRADYEGAVR